MLVSGLIITGTSAQAQIYEPEGINMPGAWNTWINPPTNNLVLASSTQVNGGKIERIDTGTLRWQTMFEVDASGGDLTGGTYEWLFTSGSSSNYYQNKWASVTVTMNTLQLYTKEGATNNSITLLDGKWYTMNFEDLGYVSSRAIFMETSAEPVEIDNVSEPASVLPNTPVTIDVELKDEKCAEENVFLRYTTDTWLSSLVVPVIMTGKDGTGEIPGQPEGTVVSYYAFTTTLATVTADYDLVTIYFENNEGLNYTYTVSSTPPVITFANLQWPETGTVPYGTDFDVFGQAYIEGVTGQPTPAPGLQAWVGYSATNTDPSTWTDWIVAPYNAPSGNNDEFKGTLSTYITGAGTFFYATRFQLNADPYVYGGYSATGGGFWDGVNNISGVLDVIVGIPEGRETGAMVYPNPTTGGLNLELPAPAMLIFTSATGMTVLQMELSSGRQQIDLTDFKKGVYHLQIITGNRMTHQTVIKR